ncbi:MAG TPA: DUF4476 domain-containing protein, partial [Flavipsychrobacter sp.]
QRSVLEIRTTDHEPIVVSVDGRHYDRHGRTITIGNLPKGWHDLRVYEYLEYKRGGGRAKLLYTGRIRIDAGTVTNCVVDRQTGRMRIRTMDMEDAYLDYDQPDNEIHSSNILTDDDLTDLKARVDDRITDTEKLKLMKSVLAERTYYSVQVRRMMDWLTFEGSKLDFAKWSYDKALDKQDYWKLEDAFTFTNSKDEFNNYISSR